MPVAQKGASGRVLDSAQYITQNSKDVAVPAEGVRKAAKKIASHMQKVGYSTAAWKQHPLTPKVANASALEWIFVVDTLNFSFWSSQPPDRQYTVSYNGQAFRGYWSLCAALNRAIDNGIPISDARFYQNIKASELARIFQPDAPHTQEQIPMLEARISALREVGTVLVQKYDGRFANLVSQCAKSSQTLVETIVREFACFRDAHAFYGRDVCVYKRAQILVADVWACFEGRGLGEFVDIDEITMFADYRVPQALHYFGAIEYSPRLWAYLKEAERVVCEHGEGAMVGEIPAVLPSGHPWEVEIRGNSVWAVEEIRRAIVDSGMHVNAILLDFYIWDYAKEFAKEMEDIPIHHTRSVFY